MSQFLADPTGPPPPDGPRLGLRARRTLARIERHLADDDPRLDDLLRGPVDHAARIGHRIGMLMLWAAVLLIAVGLLLISITTVTVGCILLATFWIPTRLGGTT